jgi:hypothetical protein
MPEVNQYGSARETLTEDLLRMQLQIEESGDKELYDLLGDAISEILGLRTELQIYKGIWANLEAESKVIERHIYEPYRCSFCGKKGSEENLVRACCEDCIKRLKDK